MKLLKLLEEVKEQSNYIESIVEENKKLKKDIENLEYKVGYYEQYKDKARLLEKQIEIYDNLMSGKMKDA